MITQQEQAVVTSTAIDPIDPETFQRLYRDLPDRLQHHVVSFLSIFGRAKMPTFSPEEYTHRAYHNDLLCAKFCYLIAVETENNQQQAEAMLKNYPSLCSRFITEKRDISDASGRTFTRKMSAYAYAFWAGDTDMCRMMQTHMHYLDDNSRQMLSEECRHITKEGLAYRLNDESVEKSTCFDMQPLLNAYDRYLEFTTRHRVALEAAHGTNPQLDAELSASMKALWLAIGKELAKVPTHVAQQFCDSINDRRDRWRNLGAAPPHLHLHFFYEPVPRRRTALIEGMKPSCFWFSLGRAHPELGRSFSIAKHLVPDDNHAHTYFGCYGIYEPKEIFGPLSRYGYDTNISNDCDAMASVRKHSFGQDRNKILDELSAHSRMVQYFPS